MRLGGQAKRSEKDQGGGMWHGGLAEVGVLSADFPMVSRRVNREDIGRKQV